MKAYRDRQGVIRLFRPEMNMKRFATSAARLTLPPIDQEELLECIRSLLRVEADWIPSEAGYSMYIRPSFIGTQVDHH